MISAYVWNRNNKRVPKICDASKVRVLMGLSKNAGLTVWRWSGDCVEDSCQWFSLVSASGFGNFHGNIKKLIRNLLSLFMRIVAQGY